MTVVLVVGAGPSGLVAACELLRRGVAVRLVDAAPEPAPYSKALLIWPPTLRVLAGLGVRAQVERAALPIRAFRYFSAGRPLATLRFPDGLAPLCLPQRETERILTDRLHQLGGAIDRGVALAAVDHTGATTLIRPDGRPEHVRPQWVIGADGAHSTVRKRLGLRLAGSTHAESYLVVDAAATGPLPHAEAHYHQSPGGALVIVALPGGRYRFFANARPGETMDRIVADRGPAGVRLAPAEWTSVFRVHRRICTRFQRGRVFLVGDAAHVHSPAGGQGLNTGIQDAHHLAAAMAAVAHGRAGTQLLESYTRRRRPVVQRVVRDADLQNRLWLLRGRTAITARDVAVRLADRAGLLRRYARVLANRSV